MEDCKSMSTPKVTNWKKLHASEGELVDPTLYRQLIRSLMYLVNSRSDLCFAMNTLSKFMVEPRRVHWVAAKHVLRYLARTVEYGLDYKRSDGIRLIGFTDSDRATVWQTERALPNVVSVWAQQQRRGLVGSKSLLL